MVQKYSEEQIEFIRNYAKKHTRVEVLEAFNEKFDMNLTIKTIKSTMSNHKIKIGVRNTSNLQRLFTKEQEVFVHDHHYGTPNKKLADLINQKFGTNFTVQQVKSWKRNHGCNSGLTGHFEKGHVPVNKGTRGLYNVGGNRTSFRKGDKPHNIVSVGTKIYKSDEYWWTKIAENPSKWQQTHRLLWEEAYGPLADNQVIIFLDGDTHNITLENLQVITRSEHIRINQHNYRSVNPELTKVAKEGKKMFESLLEVAKQAQPTFEQLEENGWSDHSLGMYKAGYDNAFFDIVRQLRNDGVIAWEQSEKLVDIFDGNDRQ